MRHTQLKAFDTVALEGGFSAAAERLGLTQPAVTIQVRALEEAYAIGLFQRTGTKVTLTEPGRILFTLTREMFGVEDRIKDFLSASGDLETGDLRLAADVPQLAMNMIATFRRVYPNVGISVSLGNHREVWRDLIERRADAIVVANPKPDARVRIVPLCNQHLIVLVSVDHQWAGRQQIDTSELAGMPAILREPQSNTHQILETVIKDANIHLDTVLELGSREAVLEAVAAGLGIGFAFDGEIPDDPRIRICQLKGKRYENLHTAACLKSQHERGVVRAFLAIAKSWAETK